MGEGEGVDKQDAKDGKDDDWSVGVICSPLFIRDWFGGQESRHGGYFLRLCSTNSESVSMFLKFVPLMSALATSI